MYVQGHAEHFAANGQRLAKLQIAHCRICSALCAGSTIWFGLSDGRLAAYNCTSHARVAAFPAHAAAVVSLAQAGMFLYSLGSDGTISVRNAFVVAGGSGGTPHVERVWRSEWQAAVGTWRSKLSESREVARVGVHVCTWNVNNLRPKRSSIEQLVGGSKCALVDRRPCSPSCIAALHCSSLSPFAPLDTWDCVRTGITCACLQVLSSSACWNTGGVRIPLGHGTL
jgi:hypothetical protein